MTRRLTPRQASEKAGVSRSTISRALKEMRLIGVRGNNNRWTIEEEELDKWMGSSVHVRSSEQKPAHDEQLRDLLTRVEIQTAQIAMLEERVEDLKQDRDLWREASKRRWWQFRA